MDEIVVTGQRIPWAPGDEELLGRLIYGAAAGQFQQPGVMEAVGSSVINRIDQPGFKGTLADVINQRNNKGPQYKEIDGKLFPADPRTLHGSSKQAYDRSMDVARGLLSGQIRDNTGGAQYFYSDDKPPSGFFEKQLGPNGQLEKSGDKIGPFTFARPKR